MSDFLSLTLIPSFLSSPVVSAGVWAKDVTDLVFVDRQTWCVAGQQWVSIGPIALGWHSFISLSCASQVGRV